MITLNTITDNMKKQIIILLIFIANFVNAQTFEPKDTYWELVNDEATLVCTDVDTIKLYQSNIIPLVPYIEQDTSTWHWGFLIMRQDNPFSTPYRYVQDTFYNENCFEVILQDTFTQGYFHICAAMFNNETNNRFTPWLSSSHKNIERSEEYCVPLCDTILPCTDTLFIDNDVNITVNSNQYNVNNGDILTDFFTTFSVDGEFVTFEAEAFGYTDVITIQHNPLDSFDININGDIYNVFSDSIFNLPLDTIINEFVIDTTIIDTTIINEIVIDTTIVNTHYVTINGQIYVIDGDTEINIECDTTIQIINNEYTVNINGSDYLINSDSIIVLDNPIIFIDDCDETVEICQVFVKPNPNNGTFIVQMLSPNITIQQAFIRIYNINYTLLYEKNITIDFNFREETITTNLPQGIYLLEVEYFVDGVNYLVNKKLIIQ